MVIRIRRAINYSGARERRWWRTREKGKERNWGGAVSTTGLRREGGRGREGERRGAPTALNAPRRRRPLSRCSGPRCASGPGGPSVRRRKQGTDRGPETIHVHLYNAVSFILPRLVIWPANEGVSRECDCSYLYKMNRIIYIRRHIRLCKLILNASRSASSSLDLFIAN